MKNELCTKCSKTNNFRAKTCEFVFFNFDAKIRNYDLASFHKTRILTATKMRFFCDFQTFWYRTSNEVNVAIYE